MAGRKNARQQLPVAPVIVKSSTSTKDSVAAPVVVKKVDDPRLRRLAAVATTMVAPDAHDVDDNGPRPRRRHQVGDPGEQAAPPQIIRQTRSEQPVPTTFSKVAAETGHMELPVEYIEKDRTALREVLRIQHQQQEDASLSGSSSSGEEDSSLYSEDSSSDNEEPKQLMKPVFVPRTHRETLAERDRIEQEEEMASEAERRRLDQRKEETLELVKQRMMAEEDEMAARVPKELADIDTDDETMNAEVEVEGWKVRELGRLMRDWELEQKDLKEQEEKDRWLAMSEEEKIAWLRENKRMEETGDKERPKRAFLQKYYHRGAFYLTEADDKEEGALAAVALHRDISAPTGEDTYDKSLLPEVMQVKNWGRQGRSKWTHLAAEDTTDKSSVPMIERESVKKKNTKHDDAFTKPKNYRT